MVAATAKGAGARLAIRHGDKLRYVPAWGWLSWDGRCWRPDTGEVEAMRLARDTAMSIREEAAQIAEPERYKAISAHAARSQSDSRLQAMLHQAQSELAIAARPEQFDQDPWLLNCENGIVDLRTGELLAHDRQAHLTKLAGTHYDPSARCPWWQSFLARIMAGNATLIEYLRRSLGYALTGDTSEQVLFFLHGVGANGKSTLLETIKTMLKDYARCGPQAHRLAFSAGASFSLSWSSTAGASFSFCRSEPQAHRIRSGRRKQTSRI